MVKSIMHVKDEAREKKHARRTSSDLQPNLYTKGRRGHIESHSMPERDAHHTTPSNFAP